jgi:hypothetical protein
MEAGAIYARLIMQRMLKRTGRCVELLLRGTGVIIIECPVSALDQAIFVEGLAQEAERSGLQYTLPDFFLGNRSHENYRGSVAIRIAIAIASHVFS